jgi:hypothetical protein
LTTTRTDEDIDRLGRSSGTTSNSLVGLSRRVDQAASAFGGIIRGAPQSLSEFATGLSSVLGTGGPVAKAISFAEGYIGVWQGLTQYGVNFGNQLDQMIIQTGRANMRMEQLASIVQSSSEDFAGLGGTANRGVQQFLTSQADFYRNFQELDMSLRQLGMTTKDINERFLQFDAMSNVSGLRQRMDDRERQAAAARFAESVDTLAKLTGKQADQLAKEQLKLSRQGNIYARDQELVGKSTEGTTARIVTRFNQMGDEIGEFTADILTKGFADGGPVNQAMRAIAPQLENYLGAIRRAQSSGNLEEVNRLENETATYLASIRRSRSAQQFAQLGSATEQTAAANRILTSMNNSAELLSDAEIRTRIASERRIKAEEVSADEIARYRQRQADEERTVQRSGEGTRAVTDVMLETLQALQLTASTAQERTVTTIFDNISGAAETLRDGIRNLLSQDTINSAISEVIGFGSSILSPDRDIREGLQDMQASLIARERVMNARGDAATADLLAQQADQVSTIIQDLNAGRINEEEARRRVSEVDQLTMGVGHFRIGSATLSAETVNAINNLAPPGEPLNIGTLGRTGSFFDNFGPGTNVTLHGIEGVFRPEHIEEIMTRSSRGTISALVKQINSTMGGSQDRNMTQTVGIVRNITSSLDGRLNTLRATISRDMRETQTISPEMIGEQIKTAFASMPADMRKAVEDAFSNTLKQPMEQLVSVSTRGTEYQERVYKNTRGISQDFLRGA